MTNNSWENPIVSLKKI